MNIKRSGQDAIRHPVRSVFLILLSCIESTDHNDRQQHNAAKNRPCPWVAYVHRPRADTKPFAHKDIRIVGIEIDAVADHPLKHFFSGIPAFHLCRTPLSLLHDDPFVLLDDILKFAEAVAEHDVNQVIKVFLGFRKKKKK